MTTIARTSAILVALGLALGGPAPVEAQTAASAPPAASAPAAAAPASAASAPAPVAAASTPAATATQPADLFDFWVGEWKLDWLNADGTRGSGRNRITKILDGTALQEEFETLVGGPPPLLKGRSLSVRSNHGIWQQSWVDNQGGYFTFTAQVDGDKRIFITGPRPLPDGKTLLQRMIFHTITPTSLVWDWQSSIDGGQTWLLQWRALYSR